MASALAASFLAFLLGEAQESAPPGDLACRWGGLPDSNMVSGAADLPADLNGLSPLWEVRAGTRQYSIPAIDGGRIYVASNDAGFVRPGYKPANGGALRCLDRASGALIWHLASPRYMEGLTPPYHFDQWSCGICSCPLVDGERVYVVGNRGEIMCCDREGQRNGNDGPFTDELAYMGIGDGFPLGPSDGDIIWIYNLIKEVDAVPHDVCGSTLLLAGDFLYACTSNGIDDRHDKVARPDSPSLIVLDKRTGKLVAADGERIGRRMLHGHWSSPAAGTVGGRTLIFFGGGDGVLYAFEPVTAAAAEVQTLKKAWSFDCNPPEYRMRRGVPVPYSRDSKKSPDGPSEIIGTPVCYKNRVYVAIGQSPLHGEGQGRLSCIDAATGAEVWGSGLVDRSLATPSIAGGLLYIADGSGGLHCFDAETGVRHWLHELGAGAWTASTFVADGKVYASSEAGVLWVLRAGSAKEVLSKIRFPTHLATPNAADGVLYVPTQKSLIAYPGNAGNTAGG
ncbi:MAG TPA: pyrrolo-quinoline quinone [Planctomycetes bacterium]|nr:pyrrolo-quinoline quinone [Planctomycetota bacterium]